MTRPFTPRCQAAIDAARAEQKAADDLVIAGMQNSIEALAIELQGCRDTLALAQRTVTDLTEKLAAAQVIIDQDSATVADLTSQLSAAEQTITDQAARIEELEEELAGQGTKTLFGWFAGPLKFPNSSPTETKADMRARCVAAFGCQPPVERIFNEGSWTVPAAGVPAIVSFTQDPVRVAAAEFDAQITAFVEALDPNVRYWLCLNHECDQTTRTYTPAEQVAGFKHFATVVRAVGKPNVKVATILMSWTLTQGSLDHWRDWYPGPDYVDALGWDAYWRPTLPHTADGIYGEAYAVTKDEGKDFLICETSIGARGHGGYMDDKGTPVPEDVRTAFVTDAIAYLDGKAAAVTWFETNKTDGNWLLEGHPAVALWKAAVQGSA